MIQKTITVDFSNDYVMPSIKATQGDALSRVYHLKLVNGGLAIDLTGCTVRALILPLGSTTPLYEDLTVTAEATGKVDYTMSGNACAVSGVGLLVVEILESGTPDPLSVLNSKECKLEITAKRDFTGVIEASTAFSTLQSALAQIGQIGTLASLLTTVKTSLVAAINELFTSLSGLAGTGRTIQTVKGNADAIILLNTALAKQTLTPASGVTFNAETYYIKDAQGVVTLVISANKTSFAAGVNVLVATLPAGYRPSGFVRGVAVTGGNIGSILISADGTINMQSIGSTVTLINAICTFVV